MEILKGGDFFTYLHDRKFIISENRARVIAHEIATAIYFMHSFGIAHRDLKPENIRVKSNGLVSILMQQPYDKSVDCWSLGIIIYLMLGRHLPFDSQDDKEIGQKTIY